MSYRWGRINSGQPYTVVALDLLRAVSHANLGRIEQMVYWFVWEHTYGKATREGGFSSRPAPCMVRSGELSPLWNVHRQHIDRARRTLVADRLLVERDGGLLPNKDLHQCPRLSQEAIQYARDTQRISTIDEPPMVQEESDEDVQMNHQWFKSEPPMVQVEPPVVHDARPPQTPLLEKRGRKKIEEEEEDNTLPPHAHAREAIPNGLSADDPHVATAIDLLKANVNTLQLGVWLGMHLDALELACWSDETWRVEAAARVMLSGRIETRRQHDERTFLNCVRYSKRSELDIGKAIAATPTGSPSAPDQPVRRFETFKQRAKREQRERFLARHAEINRRLDEEEAANAAM
jgi:hypothetical protein